MPDSIVSVEEVTPAWLTWRLQAAGGLLQGRVVSVQAGPARVNTGTIVPLQVVYSSDASPVPPRRLILKLTGRRIEKVFYTLIARSMPALPVLRCYDAVFVPEQGCGHLLFDDLSATHHEPDGPLPPPQAHYARLVDCLAQVQAAWWEHPRLQTDIGALAEDVPGHVRGVAAEAFPRFADFLGDRLAPARRRWYERVFAAGPPPAWRARQARMQALTLVHGDAHPWNFLYPRDPTRERVYLIDWAVWYIGVGVADLAYMFALAWFPERRARMEQELVRRYYDRLREYGVADYTWDQCWHDYRTAAIANLFWPIFWWARNGPPHLWWNTLEPALLAFQDLGCLELLED